MREPIDVFTARWAVLRVAAAMGFPALARQELAIAVSELATNILKYAVQGEIRLAAVEDPTGGPALEIVASDAGPPLADLATALRDGHDDRGPLDPGAVRRGGIGAGLGAVRRLTDHLEYHSDVARKSFRAVRYLNSPPRLRV